MSAVSNIYQGHLTVKSEEYIRNVVWLYSDSDTQVSSEETNPRETPISFFIVVQMWEGTFLGQEAWTRF